MPKFVLFLYLNNLNLSNFFLLCSSASSIKACAYSDMALVFLARTLSYLESISA